MYLRYGSNATIPAVPAVPASPTGTGSSGGAGGYSPQGNGTTTILTSPSPSASDIPPMQHDNGAMRQFSGSTLGLLVAGGIALAL